MDTVTAAGTAAASLFTLILFELMSAESAFHDNSPSLRLRSGNTTSLREQGVG